MKDNKVKAITFVGLGRYEEVTYFWEDKEWRTSIFPEALARIFNPEKLFVLVTPKAKTHENFRTLRERLGDLVYPIDIPDFESLGKAGEELWQIFERCVEIVDPGDEIILDITHAFRSIPFVVFGVANYLRRTKNVSIRHILYGAFEARKRDADSPGDTDKAPILDLIRLLDLSDWLSGVEFLLQRSDGTILAERLRQIQGKAWRESRTDDLPRKLQGLASVLQSLSKALHLARPCEVMNSAFRLSEILIDVRSEVEAWAKPFSVILGRLKDEVQRLSYEKPEELSAENLKKQFALIEHYLDKELIMQAITLSREWVVSWVILKRGEGDWLEKAYREEIEKALGAAAETLRGGSESIPDWFHEIPQSEETAKLWRWLTDLRNDLAHCGMRKGASSIGSIEKKAREIPQKLRSLLEDLPDTTLLGGRVEIDLKSLYGDVAKIDELETYLKKAIELAGEGKDVILTGQGPIWLYLAVSHTLHGRARRLFYNSPTTGEILIFDHAAR